MSKSVSISFPGEAGEERARAAAAMLSLAVTRAGARMAEVESATVALDELLEGLEQTGPIRRIELNHEAGGSLLSLHFDAPAGLRSPPAVAAQLIDAGLGEWRLDGAVATIVVRARSGSIGP